MTAPLSMSGSVKWTSLGPEATSEASAKTSLLRQQARTRKTDLAANRVRESTLNTWPSEETSVKSPLMYLEAAGAFFPILLRWAWMEATKG